MTEEKHQNDELRLEPISSSDTNSFEFSENGDTVKGKRLFLLIGGLLGIILAIFLFFHFKGDTLVATSTRTESQAPTTNYTNYLFDFPEITSNLAPVNEKESWIKLGITLQLENAKDQAILDKKLTLIKDSIIIFLRELRSSDLASSGVV